MKFRSIGSAFAILLLACCQALAWGPEGHEVVGSVADQLLNDHAKQEVSQIMGGVTLRDAAPWPDCARSVMMKDGKLQYVVDERYEAPCKSFDHDAIVDYVTRNWSNCSYDGKPTECHEAFHFADVAIQHDDYERKYVGTSDHDVVSAINAAIAVLQNKPAPKPFNIKDKQEALFLLAHFVGDLHQPLHVGAIYLDAAGAPVNPDQGTFDPNSETAGGNFIDEEHGNLHADWDEIPKRLDPPAGAALVAEAKKVPHSSGSLDGWAVAWASDTVMASHAAFKGLSFTGKGKHKWSVEFDDKKAYESAENKLKEQQLTKGGARLAELLNAIWP